MIRLRISEVAVEESLTGAVRAYEPASRATRKRTFRRPDSPGHPHCLARPIARGHRRGGAPAGDARPRRHRGHDHERVPRGRTHCGGGAGTMTSGDSGSRSDPDVEEDEMNEHGTQVSEARPRASAKDDELLPELVEYLRENREELREEWVGRITDAELLGAMSREEIFSEATAVYDNYVDALETGSIETLQAYAQDLSERIVARGVETDEVLGIVLLLRDVLARSLFANYGQDAELLNQILDAYEPAANRIVVTVGVSFVRERERVIREQQEAIRKLSTPVMKLRERLLLLPIIGALDTQRIRQLREQLLEQIRAHRAQVVVIDITGVAEIDRGVANHLVQTVEAAGLMGAETIITGLSSEIAQTLVDLGVDLGRMTTIGDLQGGLEEAERVHRDHPEEDTPAAVRRETSSQ